MTGIPRQHLFTFVWLAGSTRSMRVWPGQCTHTVPPPALFVHLQTPLPFRFRLGHPTPERTQPPYGYTGSGRKASSMRAHATRTSASEALAKQKRNQPACSQ